MKIRRPGPGLWWSAVCVAIALGAILGPFGVVLGGIAGPGFVGPLTWGLLFLAIEMLLLHRAYNEGRRAGTLWACSPFLALGERGRSFFPGLLVLAAAAIGRILDGSMAEALDRAGFGGRVGVGAGSGGRQTLERPRVRPVGLMAGLVVLAICLAVSLANPSAHRIYSAVLEPDLSTLWPGDRLRHIRSAFLLRQRHPPAGSGRLVLVDGFLLADGGRWDWPRSC